MPEETQATKVVLTLDCSLELDLKVTVGASVEAAIVDVNASTTAEPQDTGLVPAPEVNVDATPADGLTLDDLVNAPRLGRNEQLALLVAELDRDGWVDREALVNTIRRMDPNYNPRAVSATVSRALKTLREKGLLERQRLTPFGHKVLASISRSERLALTSEIEGA